MDTKGLLGHLVVTAAGSPDWLRDQGLNWENGQRGEIPPLSVLPHHGQILARAV